MDVERTMSFILKQQARTAERQDRTDRKLESIVKLVRTGMKMLVRIGEAQQQLFEAQRRTDERLARSDARFERLMAALLRKGTDGRG